MNMDITITMNEEEISAAIKSYLKSQDIIDTKGKTIEVNMVAGRGTNGHSAVISVKKDEEKVDADAVMATPTAPAEKAAKPAAEKKKETPVVTPPIVANPAPVAELFDDPQVKEVPDENSLGEGSAIDTLFDADPVIVEVSGNAESLFN